MVPFSHILSQIFSSITLRMAMLSCFLHPVHNLASFIASSLAHFAFAVVLQTTFQTAQRTTNHRTNAYSHFPAYPSTHTTTNISTITSTNKVCDSCLNTYFFMINSYLSLCLHPTSGNLPVNLRDSRLVNQPGS